jgi:cytochrome c peroxidase
VSKWLTKKRAIIVIVCAGFLFALSMPVANLIVGLPKGVKLGDPSRGSPAYQEAVAALGTKCSNCHTEEYILPFYARFPIAHGIIEGDIHRGTELMNMSTEFASAPEKPVRQVALAKIEYVVVEGTMPPSDYLAMHWNGGLTEEEHNETLTWIREERSQYYASAISTEKLRGEVIQPLAPAPHEDPAKVALGEKLYNDVRLSKNDTISCASCHDLAKGGTDNEQFATGATGQKGTANAPTVFNAGLQIAEFWDGRAADLQEQAAGPIQNPIEMASTWPEVIGKLEADPPFAAEFQAAYPAGFASDAITDAIATFEKTLATPGAAFDRYQLGDEGAIDDAAKKGFAIFKGRGCAQCHVGFALGGQSFEKLGYMAPYYTDPAKVTHVDLGRYNVTKKEEDKYCFKVPMLRNVALTWPYFHDGSIETLEEAVRTMAKYQVDGDFNDTEIADVVAFLKTLTGTYEGKPLE